LTNLMVLNQLGSYLYNSPDEFGWRLNEGNVKNHTLERLDSFVGAIRGNRITYKDLTA